MQMAKTVEVGSKLALRDPFFNLIGILTVTSKYTPDKVCGTTILLRTREWPCCGPAVAGLPVALSVCFPLPFAVPLTLVECVFLRVGMLLFTCRVCDSSKRLPLRTAPRTVPILLSSTS